MTTTGVLIADQARARLFTIARPKGALVEVADLVNPEGRLHDRDIDADRPGRAFDSMGRGRHAMGKHHAATEQREIRFAGQIGELLADCLRQGSYERLVLCAPPKLLGFIREALPERVADCLMLELDQELAHLSDAAIRAHLAVRLPTVIQSVSPPAA